MNTDFMKITPNEKVLSKAEIATYLYLYTIFTSKLIKPNNFNKSFIDIFDECNETKTEFLKNISCLDYEIMIEISNFFIANKIFSYMTDEHLEYLLAKDFITHSYSKSIFVNDNKEISPKKILKLIRNALNHNDQENSDLYRLIMNFKTGNLDIEIFLRQIDFHIRISVNEYLNIMQNLISAKSAFGYGILDKDNHSLTKETLKDKLNYNELGFFIEHIFKFNEDEIIKDNDLYIIYNKNIPENKKHIKNYQFTNEQIDVIKFKLQLLEKYIGINCDNFIPFLSRDVIPFGIFKLDAYRFDFNYLINCFKNKSGCLATFIETLNNQKFGNNIQDEAWNLYYSLNIYDIYTRALNLYLSYLFDSLITDDKIIINDKIYERKKIRDAFVHGRWFNWIDNSNKSFIKLSDYEYGDNNRFKNNWEAIFEINDLIKCSKTYHFHAIKEQIRENDFLDFPITVVTSSSKGENGIVICFRKNQKEYLCNLSLVESVPPWIILINDMNNNQLHYPTIEEKEIFFEELKKLYLDSNLKVFEPLLKNIKKNNDKLTKCLQICNNLEEINLYMLDEYYELKRICNLIKNT